MKKLNITKEQFNKSRYFQKKYGKLEYVSESGKLFKTDKGNVLKFNESTRMARRSARRFNESAFDMKQLSRRVNDVYDRLESLYDDMSDMYDDLDGDELDYMGLLSEAKDRVLRVSADLAERIDQSDF